MRMNKPGKERRGYEQEKIRKIIGYQPGRKWEKSIQWSPF